MKFENSHKAAKAQKFTNNALYNLVSWCLSGKNYRYEVVAE